MKHIYFNIWLLLSFIFITSCSNDENFAPEIRIDSSIDELVLAADKDANLNIDFTTNTDWNAKLNVDWAILSPTSGKMGKSSVRLISKENNNTGEKRTGTITIYSKDVSVDIPFIQLEKNVINITETLYQISYIGGDIIIKYSTNIPKDQIRIKCLNENIDWIDFDLNKSRELSSENLTLDIKSNPARKERTAKFKLYAVDKTDSNKIIFESETITIKQEMVPVGTSSDFSKDKIINVLQEHTIGKGIPLVFLGDGFLDKDIESGYYIEVMNKAMENFFTEEPIKSLRDYFDVWAINAVSFNNAFGSQYTTKFSCKLEGGGSTRIDGNHEKVIEYIRIIPELNNNDNLKSETTCIVILNTTDYAGTCYFGFNDLTTNKTINLAIGYCPMINGIEDDMFRRVLCHECIGHGFAKLLDEYSYQEMGTIPFSEIEQNQKVQKELGWYMNVDFVNDREKVLWNKFLKNSHYKGIDNFGELLSIYEGACTYWKGAFRPTNESMMRSNTHGFNAPSREAIYKRIMSLANGNNWKYDFEKFVEFDIQHLPTPDKSRSITESYFTDIVPTKPIFTNMYINLQ